MQVIELSHPLKNHYLTILRDKNTTVEDFRAYASKLSYLLILEGTRNTKSHHVINALMSAYPSNDWVVLVIQGGSWAYSYKGWDGLRKDNLCGPYDFLV